MLGATVDRADGDHRRVERRDLAADDGLQVGHQQRRQGDRVLGGVRVGAVAAGAAYGDVHRIDVGQRIAGHQPDAAGGQRGIGVQRQDHLGPREPLVETAGQHRPRPGTALLGRLADHHQGPRPLLPPHRQHRCRAEKRGHVQIVAAGVHGEDLFAALGSLPRAAGPGQAGPLLDRQAVEIGANHHGRAVAVREHRHQPVGDPALDAVLSHLLGDLEAEFAQPRGDEAGGLALEVGDLRVGVQAAVGVEQRRQLGVDRVGQPSGGCGKGREQEKQERGEGALAGLHRYPPGMGVTGARGYNGASNEACHSR